MRMQLFDAWTHLNHGLTVFESVWRPQPFRLVSTSTSWQHSLHERALNLDDATFRDINCNNELLYDWVSNVLSDLSENGDETEFQTFQSMLAVLQEFPKRNTNDMKPAMHAGRTQPREANGVPMRKFHQVEAFAQLVPEGTNPIIDWCSGKGHLARWMHFNTGGSCSCGRPSVPTRPVHCLEIDAKICRSGEAMAKKQKKISPNGVLFYEHNVLTDALPTSLQGHEYTYTALHACGELHRATLVSAVKQQARQVVVVPCCYEKHFGMYSDRDVFQPLSTVVKERTSLSISREDLFLAVADGIVTSNAKEAGVREKEQAWRLAFDLWWRDQEGVTSKHLTVPSAPYRLLAEDDFGLFLRHCIASKGRNSVERKRLEPALEATLLAKGNLAIEDYAARGEELRQKVERLELIRRAFQRPFELWLTTDSGLFLEENGYKVELHKLCDRSITPRNVAIVAQRL